MAMAMAMMSWRSRRALFPPRAVLRGRRDTAREALLEDEAAAFPNKNAFKL